MRDCPSDMQSSNEELLKREPSLLLSSNYLLIFRNNFIKLISWKKEKCLNIYSNAMLNSKFI